MDKQRLQAILSGFAKARIAVVGDFFLDKWLLIDRALDEPSVETGLTAYQVVGRLASPGAAGTITNNLASLCVGTIYAVGALGDDGEGYEMQKGLRASGVNTDYLLVSGEIFTPTYIKPLFNYDVVEETHRLDIRNRACLPAAIEAHMIQSIQAVSTHVDAIIVLDQVLEPDTGVITEAVRNALIDLGRNKPELILYADSRAFTQRFSDMIVKCNHLEAAKAHLGEHCGDIDEALINECALAMAKRTRRRVFVTCGERGVVTIVDDAAKRIPAMKVLGNIDICGAGDATTAGIVSALCCGASNEEAAIVGNLTSSITIQQIGTTGVATQAQILRQFDSYEQ